MAVSNGGAVDLSASPPPSPRQTAKNDSSTSLASLGSTLDAYSLDIPGFINDLLAPHLAVPAPGAPAPQPDLTPIDKVLNDLLTRLSLLSQDTSSALEQSIHDISRTVPRLTYDLQFMRESATSLQSSLSSVQSQVRHGSPGDSSGDKDTEEAKTHASLEKLAHLDKLKTRMESARDILREAESWSTLESEITAFIEVAEWSKAGLRLAEAGRSMVVFQSTPGEYESRKTLLVSLQNELERALAKALDTTITEDDTEGVARLREVFELIEREDEFKEYYFKARRKGINEEWNAVILDIGGSDAAVSEGKVAVKFNVFLPKFYTTLLEALHTERARIPLIFDPDRAAHILANFLQTTLDGLSPSMQSRLANLAEYYGAAALPELIKAYRATEELALGVQGIMDKMAFNTQGGIVSGSAVASSPTAGSPNSTEAKTPRTPHKRTMSRRFSRAPAALSDAPTAVPSEWETTLYEPFLDLQGSYPSLERRYLSNLLRTEPSLSAISTKGDASRALLDRATAAFNIADEAIARCLAFTHGYGAHGLVRAIAGLFEDFLEAQRDRVLAPTRSSTVEKKDDLDLEGLDYSSEDWTSFQLGLHVLSACRGIRDRLAKFEERLQTSLAEVVQISKIQPSDPTTFRLQETTIGAIALLQQSPLNSADLHELLSTASTTRLQPVHEALAGFTKDAQQFLQGIILSPLQAQLQAYPKLSVWSQPDKAAKRGDLQVPTFSLSPTDTIARVSEGLLNLLRVFEVYAADDALAFSLETLPYVEADLLADAVKESAAGLGAETVLSTWVSSLSLGLLAQLTKTTLPRIRSLSTGGAAQLASDLAYLSNAVRALDVEWEELERWKEAAEVDGEEAYRKRLKEVRDRGEGEDIWRKVGALRGWN